jgi:Protein of unknown function (DUF2796)
MKLAPAGRKAAACFIAAFACALGPVHAVAGAAHVHGVATVSVSTEGDLLRILLEAPMDVLVGFEHAPRTPAERQAVDRARQALTRSGLLRPSADAECVAIGTPAAANDPRPGSDPAHADLEMEYAFRCGRPGKLRQVELDVFSAFPRLQRIEAMVVTATEQGKRTLKRPERILQLAR